MPPASVSNIHNSLTEDDDIVDSPPAAGQMASVLNDFVRYGWSICEAAVSGRLEESGKHPVHSLDASVHALRSFRSRKLDGMRDNIHISTTNSIRVLMIKRGKSVTYEVWVSHNEVGLARSAHQARDLFALRCPVATEAFNLLGGEPAIPQEM